MCKHSISDHLQLARVGLATAGIDRQMACDAYDAYADILHRVLFEVVQCEECANAVMHHALFKVCTEGVPHPSLSRSLRTAFACACATPGDAGKEVCARITAWYLEGSVTSDSPLPLGSDPGSDPRIPLKGAA